MFTSRFQCEKQLKSTCISFPNKYNVHYQENLWNTTKLQTDLLSPRQGPTVGARKYVSILVAFVLSVLKIDGVLSGKGNVCAL